MRITIFDSLSGRDLFETSDSILAGCSGQGPQDANVESALAETDPDDPHFVRWIADDDALRASLAETGAWSREELASADTYTLRSRALWIGACQYREDWNLPE